MASSHDPAATSQASALAFLGSPDAFGGLAVRRIDTHASSVFLAGDRALKVKRAVRLPFLDYSTLQKRKAACEEELRINQPSAPQIYRAVVPIVRGSDGRLAIGGDGAVVEWALDMVRFDEDQTLDRLAATDGVDDAMALEIADAIARAHRQANRIAGSTSWPGSIPTLVARNTTRFRSSIFPPTEIHALDSAGLSAFARVQSVLQRRAEEGFVRRCHGDLHLANIARLDGHPVLFDAIEFDPAIATTDVLYDLAFTIMDLLRFKQARAAGIVFNRYLAVFGQDQIDGLAALPLFMSLRAAIRAHVLLTRHERERDRESVDSARAYFALANDLIHPKKPELVAVGGLSGTGKSVLARALAGEISPPPGAVIVRSDIIRKQMFNVEETARLPAAAYDLSVTQAVYGRLVQTAARVLEQGLSVIADAAWLQEAERTAIREMADARGVAFGGLFLNADLATRLTRIGSRKNDASDATVEIATLQEDYKLGYMDWAVVDASGSERETLARSLAQLGR